MLQTVCRCNKPVSPSGHARASRTVAAQRNVGSDNMVVICLRAAGDHLCSPIDGWLGGKLWISYCQGG